MNKSCIYVWYTYIYHKIALIKINYPNLHEDKIYSSNSKKLNEYE